MTRGRKITGDAKKSVQVTLKIEPRMKYLLDLIATQTGVNITAFVEQSAQEAAKKLPLAKKWIELWDEHEGVRKLNELSCRGYKRSPSDERLALFVKQHPKKFATRERIITTWETLDSLLSGKDK